MKPVVLIIMDGYGLRDDERDNAVAMAKKPNLDRLMDRYPHTSLGSAGRDVGLPEGQMGNSEVGHLNLGAGRIVYQDYTRISLAVEEDRLVENPVIAKAMDDAMGGSLHLMGLLSDGGVHSHNTHLYALLEMAGRRGLEKVYVHAILDGRDVPPKSALGYFEELEDRFAAAGVGKVATVSGRYYTMDRDRRWERIEMAYRALTEGAGFTASTPEEAVKEAYARGESDEFVKPTVVDEGGLIRDGDAVIFFNFRPDRARQITRALVQEDFGEFRRRHLDLSFVCMTQYDASIDAPVAFSVEYIDDTLGEVVGRAGLRQLRIAETEKYAHVTYFFNGGREEELPGEDRVLIPSPKVATYDLQPEMSAPKVTKAVLERIESGVYDLVVMNYANSDMVGHTGVLEAAVRAVEAVDTSVGAVVGAVLERGGAALVTADHGNAEKMADPETGQPHTAHTTNRVPFILALEDGETVPGTVAGTVPGMGLEGGVKCHALREGGILADVAPTVLQLLGLERPEGMTGRSLIV